MAPRSGRRTRGSARARAPMLSMCVAFLLALPLPARAGPTEETTILPLDTLSVRAAGSHRFLRTTAGIALINQSIWTYNRFIREGGGDPQFRVGWDTFADNVREGFAWDGNDFWTNQFYHPAHGSLHFTAARASGYDYWGASLWALAGSWIWEHAGETNTPSTNDLVNSTLGGIALGEPLFRLSARVVDNRARGGERWLRELCALVVAPGAELSRVLSGEAFRASENPADRVPGSASFGFRAGYRTLGDAAPRPATSENGFLAAHVRYGDPFDSSDPKPFRHFDFDLLYNLDDARHKIGKIKVAGLVWGGARGDAGETRHAFGCFQHFDFYDNPSYEFGSESVGAGYLGRMPAAGGFEIGASAHLKGVLLSATRTDYPTARRSYDFGVGLGYEASLSLGAGLRDFVTVARGESFVSTVDGAGARHRVGLTTVAVDVPVLDSLAAGADYVRYDADRTYDAFGAHSATSHEARVYLAVVIE